MPSVKFRSVFGRYVEHHIVLGRRGLDGVLHEGPRRDAVDEWRKNRDLGSTRLADYSPVHEEFFRNLLTRVLGSRGVLAVRR